MENKGQGIFYGVIGVATLIVAIIGATFAYFSATATGGDDVINGTTGQGAQLSLVVDEETTVTGALIPLNVVDGTSQLSSALTGAGSPAKSCQDANNNTVCHVYSITINNTGAAAVTAAGTMTLTSTAPNMKWKLLTNATTDDASASPVSQGTAGTITSSVSLPATNGTHTYYVVVWLEETGSPQDQSQDTSENDNNKTFSGSVTFEAAGGQGLTATFSS